MRVLVRPARRDVGEDSDGDNLEQQHRGIGEAAHGSLMDIAAIPGRPITVSGWDMAARRPKASRRLVGAGADLERLGVRVPIRKVIPY